MGACSTVTISRADALAVLLEVWDQVDYEFVENIGNLDQADNTTLADILYEVVGCEGALIYYPGLVLSNFFVVDEYSEKDIQSYRPYKSNP